jgi:hypothetical protein
MSQVMAQNMSQVLAQNRSLENLMEIQPEAFVAKFAQARCLSCDQNIKMRLDQVGRVTSTGSQHAQNMHR